MRDEDLQAVSASYEALNRGDIDAHGGRAGTRRGVAREPGAARRRGVPGARGRTYWIGLPLGLTTCHSPPNSSTPWHSTSFGPSST
jgi:hypothetical protein